MSSQQRVPPCRSEFVQQWLEDHAKYFAHPVSKPEVPPLVTRIDNSSFHTQAQSYQCSKAMEIKRKEVNTRYNNIQPPYIMSPVKPPYSVRNYF